MNEIPAYQRKLQLTTGPEDPLEAIKLQQTMGFNYIQCIEEYTLMQ